MTYYTQDAARELMRAVERIRDARDVRDVWTARAIAEEAARAAKWGVRGRAALTQAEARVIEAFLAHFRANGIAPSHSELARVCGFKGKRSAAIYLDRLHAKGYLTLVPGERRRYLPA